jgi:hypothetical protein
MGMKVQTRRQRWNAFRRKRHLGLEAMLSGIGAVAILLLLVAGVCASLARRMSV